MFKACSRCGKIHDSNFKCNAQRIYQGGKERELRSSYSWTNKSLEIREKANHLCEVCRDQGVFTYDKLEVHHITKLRDNENGLLDNYNLICLCPEHHQQADRNEIDKSYLLKLAEQRENK